MKSYNFSANAIDYGNWYAMTQEQAQEKFADDSGYTSWAAMVEQAEEFGGNNVEVKEVADLQFILEDALTALTLGDKDTAMCCIDKALEMVKSDD